ncbi:sugar O-acetyltransferase [Aquisphaera insulae]|uniref:sugar O-acetyltransferase n=1 Tax=Aquisphaera insulae TaxID=2712864 RepID=UPI0013EA72A3|nr:sugar O-acetyltransferase [Aquisphaera insulae]
MRSEREKMLAGELYDPADPVLVAAARRARELLATLNRAAPGDDAERRRVCKDLFGRGGDSVRIQPPFYCDYGAHIQLGESVYFNFNCVVLDVCEVRIGDFSLFGPAVQIYTPLHPLEHTVRRFVEYGKPVEIGSDVWVGGGAIICPGVRIGSRSIIGAGSVVTRDIPEGVLAVGNPCRVIREVGANGTAGGHSSPHRGRS